MRQISSLSYNVVTCPVSVQNVKDNYSEKVLEYPEYSEYRQHVDLHQQLVSSVIDGLRVRTVHRIWSDHPGNCIFSHTYNTQDSRERLTIQQVSVCQVG